jgi:hypothetical protein
MSDKNAKPVSSTAKDHPELRRTRLRLRLRELNAKSESEMTIIKETVERAKAAFRAEKS